MLIGLGRSGACPRCRTKSILEEFELIINKYFTVRKSTKMFSYQLKMKQEFETIECLYQSYLKPNLVNRKN